MLLFLLAFSFHVFNTSTKLKTKSDKPTEFNTYYISTCSFQQWNRLICLTLSSTLLYTKTKIINKTGKRVILPGTTNYFTKKVGTRTTALLFWRSENSQPLVKKCPWNLNFHHYFLLSAQKYRVLYIFVW